jgi:hypothetical protein
MSRGRLILCGVALAALFPVTACSHHHGRVAFNGGEASTGDTSRDPDADDPDSDDPAPGDPGGPHDGPDDEAPVLDDLVGRGVVRPVLATAGNLVSSLTQGEPSLNEALDPLARVSVGGHTIIGGGDGEALTALGVSVASQQQADGQLATLGVLKDGQIVAANAIGPGANGDLIGATAGGRQVIGQGQSQAIGAGLLSPTQTQGDVASVNVLSGGDILNVQVPGATPGAGGSVVQGVVNTVGNVVPGAAPAPGGPPAGAPLLGNLLGGLHH